MQDLSGPCVLESAGAPCLQAEDQGACSLRAASPAGRGAHGHGLPAQRDLKLPGSCLAEWTLGYYYRRVTESTGTDCYGQGAAQERFGN